MFNFNTPDPQLALQKRYSQGQTSHLTGNRVYNGSAPSPHAGGGLNKSGYAKRDQEAQAKQQFLKNQIKSGGF